MLFDVALHGVDVLAGPNGAGKTTRGPLAITAAIEGLATTPTDPRRPYLDTTPEGTAVTLRVETPSGLNTLTRQLDLEKGKAVTEANQRARDLVGIPPTAWDLRDFATGTDGDRGKILDAVARAGGALERWDAPRAQAHVRGLLMKCVQDELDETTITGPLDECIEDLPDAPDGATWLRAAEVWAVACQKAANTEQKEAGAVLGRLTQSVPAPTAGDPVIDAERARELRLQQVGWERSAQDAQRARDGIARHEAEGVRLREQLAAAEAEGRRLAIPLPAPEATVVSEEPVREAERALTAPVPGFVWQGPTVEQAQAAFDLATRSATDRARARTASEELRATRADALSALRSQIATLEGLSKHGEATCRHCGGVDPLGVTVGLASAKTELVEAERLALQARSAASRAIDDHNAAQQALQAATSALSRAKTQEEGRAGHAERFRAERQRALQAARDLVAGDQRRAAERVARHAADEKQRIANLDAARKRWKATKDAITSWEAAEVPQPAEPPSDETRQTIDVELREIDARVLARKVREDHLQSVNDASRHYEDARRRWRHTRALVDCVRKARDDVAKAAYAPIEKAAQELLAGVQAQGLPMPYFEGPYAYGATVYHRGRVPYASLSESEQRITAAALVYALATVAGCPCRLVLLDGLEVVQHDHRAPLVAALVHAQQAGKVDSVVITVSSTQDEDLAELEATGATVQRFELPDALEEIAPVQTTQEQEPAPVSEPPTETADCPF
jgi:hypothetical protein